MITTDAGDLKTMNNELCGREAIESLADIYRQIYVRPEEGASAKYADIVQRGQDPEDRDLSHFITDENDRLAYVDTPAGDVLTVTLTKREDFETIIRIMANKCEPVAIPATQGASILDGVINWRKIERHRDEYLKEAELNGTEADWNAEFRNFTSNKRNFKDALIILSTGPYSAVHGSRFGISDEEWKIDSGKIRLCHECTHFICRNLYPDKKDAVWDELVADAVGIYAAFKRLDIEMEKIFLGIEGNSYTGGRLENYMDADTDADRQKLASDLTPKICEVLDAFKRLASEHKDVAPFELAVLLEEAKEEIYD